MSRLAALAVVVAMLGGPAAAATPPALIGVLHDFVRAASGSDGAAFNALFVPDASITDTVAPYHWQGKDAASAYFTALQADLKAVGWVGMRLDSAGDPFAVVGAKFAYASLPLVVAYTSKGVAHRDAGTFTLSLQLEGAGWKISSATWTYTKAP